MPNTSAKTRSSKKVLENKSEVKAVKNETEISKEQIQKKKIKVNLDDSIYVVSCVDGELLWKSQAGHREQWLHFGDRNPMLVSDLFEMRNHDQRFFSENWVTLEGDNAQYVMDYLQITKYYKNFKTANEFDNVFTLSPSEIESSISKYSSNMKEVIARRAKEKVQDGSLDSYQKIESIEKATGFDLHEDF